MNLSNLHGRRGDLAQAIAAGEEAAGLIPETAQSTSLLAWNRISLSYWLAGDGRFAEGLANLEAALEEFGRPGGNPMLLSLAQDLCARVWLTLGQVARAHRLVDSPANGAGRVRARQQYTRARVRLAMGQSDQGLLAEVQSLVGEADPVGIAAGIDLAVRGPEAPLAARLESLQRAAQDHECFALAAMAASLRTTDLVRSGRRAAAAKPPCSCPKPSAQRCCPEGRMCTCPSSSRTAQSPMRRSATPAVRSGASQPRCTGCK